MTVYFAENRSTFLVPEPGKKKRRSCIPEDTSNLLAWLQEKCAVVAVNKIV